MNTQRILVVDDEPGVTRSLKINLESAGRFDVTIENRAVNALGTPIVFLTALATNEDTGGQAITAGATVYVAKPVLLGELIRCIDQHVRQ